MQSGSPLRLGILVNSLQQPAWVADMLGDVVAGGSATIALVVLNEASPEAAWSGSQWQRARMLYKNRASLPYEVYRRLDARRYSPRGCLFDAVDIRALVEGVPLLRVRPRLTRYTDRFDADAIAEIHKHELDVALLLGFRILRGEALQIARHGVWSYHHGDNRRYRGGPAGFWEVFDGSPDTGAVLQVLTEDLDGGRVLARSRSRTDAVSVIRNKIGCYSDAAPLVKRELAVLRNERRLGFEAAACARPDLWPTYDRPIYKAPRPGHVMQLAARLGSRLLKAKMAQVMSHNQWVLLYHMRGEGEGAGSNIPDCLPYKYKLIEPPPNRSWADPFPVRHGDDYYVFFEDVPARGGRGAIAVMQVDRAGKVGSSRIVLSRPHHLSYPFMFQWQGQWYLLPQAAIGQPIELFRAKSFPDGWESAGVVLETSLLDPTLAEIDGCWWLFGAVRNPGSGEGSALNLYSAPSPLGPWTPHAYNPVKVDVRGARPGGRLFQRDGVWYRPAQDGAPRYGSAIVLQRIETLSPTAYREVPVGRIEPNWLPNLNGVHTINAEGPLSVIDARRRVFTFAGRAG